VVKNERMLRKAGCSSLLMLCELIVSVVNKPQMPPKKGKPGVPPDSDKDKDGEPKAPDTRKRMSASEIDVDDVTGMLKKTEEKIFNPETKRWVSVDSLAGKTLLVDILRNEVSELRTQVDISQIDMHELVQERHALMQQLTVSNTISEGYQKQLDIANSTIQEIQQERDSLEREVSLLRIAVKDADKQDNDIHILEEKIAEKDKKIAELLNNQIEIADATQLVDNSAGIEPKSPSTLSPKLKHLSLNDDKSDDSD